MQLVMVAMQTKYEILKRITLDIGTKTSSQSTKIPRYHNIPQKLSININLFTSTSKRNFAQTTKT